MLATAISPSFYHPRAKYISSLYNAAKASFPLTENENSLISNALIELSHNPIWKNKLCSSGIPPYFVSNPDFRSRFIEYLNSSNDIKLYIRQNIFALKHLSETNTALHVYNAQQVSEISDKLLGYVTEYVREEIPQLLVACHGIRHLADLRNPQDEFTHARKIRRRVIAHIGPPNSGKTFKAFQRLKDSSTGIYCSPLRMLAWEMHEKLCSSNIKSGLLTGQENTLCDEDTHISCTVEMALTDRDFDCVVLDEMQMVGDPCRGFAWSRAYFGFKAPEIHICGSHACVPVAMVMANVCGDVVCF
ncbi:P-loop containing nucleoside triphosphate hydrolase [Babesia duncani]|uniref:P-loop containing nucleoside triphosphate hydrolase n=1 Tax=Babesia duncani TaxID=323732 RepID=A0AAD9PN35_9APIC|nr:P-loop containing nucleoside triphosphate hydrolase [Babesia duncani]